MVTTIELPPIPEHLDQSKRLMYGCFVSRDQLMKFGEKLSQEKNSSHSQDTGSRITYGLNYIRNKTGIRRLRFDMYSLNGVELDKDAPKVNMDYILIFAANTTDLKESQQELQKVVDLVGSKPEWYQGPRILKTSPE